MFFNSLVDFLFPPRCPVCQSYVPERGGWCAACLEKTLQPHRLPLSPELYRELDGAWAVGYYQGGLRELIRRLKYRRQRSTIPYINHFLQRADQHEVLVDMLHRAEMAIPVPLHEDKQRQRGFNQAELIFQEWAKRHALPLQANLLRTRATLPQYGLKLSQRRDNMKGAFVPAAGARIVDRHILLLDDIMTTGSTLHACADSLHGAGAASVSALVLASDR
jgi:ComF family protein